MESVTVEVGRVAPIELHDAGSGRQQRGSNETERPTESFSFEGKRGVATVIIEIDPRLLRLPTSRRDGADPWKLQRQIAKHGKAVQGMPRLFGIRGKDGEIKLQDGVTRATRVAKLLPGQTVAVEIIDEHPDEDYSGLPKVEDKLP